MISKVIGWAITIAVCAAAVVSLVAPGAPLEARIAALVILLALVVIAVGRQRREGRQ